MKYLVIPFAMLAAGSAFANQTVSKSVDVFANIPTAEFYVEQDGTWMTQPQELVYNAVTGALRPFDGQRMVARSTAGAIQARLDSAPIMTSGSDSIGLTVSVNNVTLSTVNAEILSEDDAKNRTFMPFKIEAVAAGTNGYAAGNYQGTVNMTFETPVPTVGP
ncbi:CS1 type fimbrial major subunit [Pseudomonas sp. NPDC089406]|uniref:CS1 type fimbrial major subunit n=1 Tax=Pseudomonas sp. NPDC089406 TaxID=3364463 RepID=UPI00384DD9BE